MWINNSHSSMFLAREVEKLLDPFLRLDNLAKVCRDQHLEEVLGLDITQIRPIFKQTSINRTIRKVSFKTNCHNLIIFHREWWLPWLANLKPTTVSSMFNKLFQIVHSLDHNIEIKIINTLKISLKLILLQKTKLASC